MIPIALFTYNRSENLQRTLDCLKNNKIDLLYIFSDGPKNGSDKEKIKKVRKIINQINWVKTEKFYHKKNIGLSKSVIFGVNKVFEKYDTIISIEDDICIANKFYEYMKTCLEKYRNNPKIAGVTGLRYPIKEKCFENYKYDIFFYPRFSSWGWGTWKKKWQGYTFNTDVLLRKTEKVKDKIIESGMVSMYNSLKTGTLSGGWDVYYGLNMIANNQYFVYPTRNMIENTGISKGTHASSEKPAYKLKWSANINSSRIRFPNQITLNKEIKKNMGNFFVNLFLKKDILTKLKNYLSFPLSKFNRIKQKIFDHKPHPSKYTTTDEPTEVPCQKEAYLFVLNNFVKEKDKVLDVGCGIGYGINILSTKAAEVYGVDVDKKAINYCQNNIFGKSSRLKELKHYDGYHLPFKDKEFDIVTCIDVIEHVKDYDTFIDELLRVAKDFVMFSTPRRQPKYTNPDGTPKNYWHFREWSFEELDNILKQHKTTVDWYFLNGLWDGPFTITEDLQENTLALLPALKPQR
ncbi:MAG: methyltransferase domain-containing protein [Candidatus Thorarchaeota archaeon]